MSELYGMQVLVEDAGIKSYGNMHYDEKEFIEVCRKENDPVLIDTGHANANFWKHIKYDAAGGHGDRIWSGCADRYRRITGGHPAVQ